jgi:hypothetical protein
MSSNSVVLEVRPDSSITFFLLVSFCFSLQDESVVFLKVEVVSSVMVSFLLICGVTISPTLVRGSVYREEGVTRWSESTFGSIMGFTILNLFSFLSGLLLFSLSLPDFELVST